MTKYAYFPIIDQRSKATVPVQKMPTYSTSAVFNPGNDSAPWSGYNPNVESELRNQIFALQKCSQSVFVPSSTSDLYTYSYTPKKADMSVQSSHLPHALLFEKNKFNTFNPNPNTKVVGANVFMNATRCQLKET
jgi:hypothetical protein